jgi:nucleolar protein 12
MAKSKDKPLAKPESRPKSDKSFIKLDKKAFDPALASLFASSVRAVHPRVSHSEYTNELY